jgi:hypothetical protein
MQVTIVSASDISSHTNRWDEEEGGKGKSWSCRTHRGKKKLAGAAAAAAVTAIFSLRSRSSSLREVIHKLTDLLLLLFLPHVCPIPGSGCGGIQNSKGYII